MRATGRARLATTSRRSLMLAIPITLGSLTIGGSALSTVGSARNLVNSRSTAAFPLLARPGQPYLEDSAGKPFLIHGDAAWSLIAELTREEVDHYLDDRRTRGFNTILVELIEHQYATHAPANAYHQRPFRAIEPPALLNGLVPPLNIPDFSMPNEAYFAHADWVLHRAAAKGFLVLLTPAYAGAGGGGSGWYQAMVANGPERLRRYGEYLGRRYRDFANILWVHAGDYNPPRKDLVEAIAEGIRQFDPRALHTAHGSRETAALDYWQEEPWLQVNSIYAAFPRHWSDRPVYATALEQHARPEGMPFFLIEGVYENMHDASEWHLRMQAYQTILSGAAGQIFGNNPIWHFDGSSEYRASMTWQEALDSRGARSMTHLHELLTTIPWWRLEPDVDNTLLTAGLGSEGERAVAARAADGTFAILYLPSSREVTLDLGELAGPEVAVRWYDPADGQFLAVGGSPFPATGSRAFRPKPSNSFGFDDWVLVLESIPETAAH